MSSLSATQSDGYYLPPEYFESGKYKTVSRNKFASETLKATNVGHNQWLKHGVVRFELPEKVVCGGCKHSIGRGTRYNARKKKTEQMYFSTPIFEFALKCRNCSEPWVIRTDPKERGFEYVSGVKRQAGQDRRLVTGETSITRSTTSNAAAAATTTTNELDTLEASVVATTKGRTEREELEALLKINKPLEHDADHNATIRNRFRKDRREKRRRLVEGKQRGLGMALLPTNDNDLLLAKETTYGRAVSKEASKLANVRKSSIFQNKPQTKKRRRKSTASTPDTVTSAAAVNVVASSSRIPPPQPPLSSLAASSMPRKTKLKISKQGTILSIQGQESSKAKGGGKTKKEALDSSNSNSNSNSNNSNNTIKANNDSLSFLLGAYGSSDDEDED